MTKRLVSIETITPKMGQEFLTKVSPNRPISNAHVNDLAADMVANLWVFNGDPIRFNSAGELIDGRHRISAGIKAKRPFETVVIRDLEAAVMPTIDCGRRRSAADHLAIGGYTHSTAVAATGKAAMNYLIGERMNSKRSNASLLGFIEAQDQVARYAYMAKPAYRIVSTSALGAVMFLGTRATGIGNLERRAELFAQGVAKGESLAADDPRLALRNTMINMRARTKSGAAPSLPWSFAMCVIAWNHWLKQTPVTYIRTFARNGAVLIPDIIGAPTRGAGLESLAGGVRLTPTQLKALDPEATGMELVGA